jgi:hypothetical protein
MSQPWFDPQTGEMLFERYVVERPSFQAITEDLVITDAELSRQAETVKSLFRELEGKLPPEVRSLATEALSELSVLNILQLKRLSDMQE